MRTITINELEFINGAGDPAPASSTSAPAPASSAGDAYGKLYNDTDCSAGVPGGVSCDAPLKDEVNAAKQAEKDGWRWVKTMQWVKYVL